MFKGACKCVYAHAGRVTDVVQRWVKDGELFGEDVLVHAEGPGVGTTDVEALLAKNHVDLRLERAEREEHTAETEAHLVGPDREEERKLTEPWVKPENTDYKATSSVLLKRLTKNTASHLPTRPIGTERPE